MTGEPPGLSITPRDHVAGPPTASVTLLPALLRHAAATGADVERVEEELNARTHRERVLEDVESGEQNGVIWTPTFFINGRRFGYAPDLDTLLTALRGADAAIVRAPSPG